tara:strand:- start:510 stop:956 length:447 start_codon:yes stop_codon:yes gene_type:complete
MQYSKRIFIFLLFLLKIYILLNISNAKELHDLKIVTGSKDINLLVEIADSNKEREYGLMFRETLPENKGMLFIYPEAGNIGIWMKNTYIPLDIIFISEEKVIKKIIYSARPLDDQIYFSEYMTKYALEINAGLAEMYNIKEGNRVYFE